MVTVEVAVPVVMATTVVPAVMTTVVWPRSARRSRCEDPRDSDQHNGHEFHGQNLYCQTDGITLAFTRQVELLLRLSHAPALRSAARAHVIQRRGRLARW
jgi:hypothetical protein